jgi:hypothetical protein
MRKFLIFVLGLATLSGAGSLLLHFEPLCGEEIVTEKASPDGRYVAALMSRNCGATTPYVVHINLRSADSRFRANFFDGTIKGGEIWGSSNYSGERFCWSDSKRIEIGYPADNGARMQRTWRDVTIGGDYRNPACQ